MDKLKESSELPNSTRRRISQAGLVAPVVLATLTSKSALGAAPYNCTISGKLSGNLSTHGGPVSCAIGKSHGFWKNTNKHLADWSFAGLQPNDPFTKVGFANQYKHSNGSSKTMLQVLELGGGAGVPPYEALGREAVCAYLNAFRFAPDFPLTGAQVVSMFNAAITTAGFIPVAGAIGWDAEVVKNYFESLHD